MGNHDSFFSKLRERLSDLGFRPSSGLGQNFLLDSNLLDAIVRDSGITGGDDVIEIGPGPGLLTERIAKSARRVTAVEIDERLVQYLRETLGHVSNLTILHGDALGSSKRGLHPEIEKELKSGARIVIGNLPYNISAPLIANLFRSAHPPARGIFMIQKEAAERMLATAGTREFGSLTIMLSACCRIEWLRNVSAEVFRPRPNVDSVVVKVTPLPDRLNCDELDTLEKIVTTLFTARRKKIGSRLDSWFPSADLVLKPLGASADLRPDQAAANVYISLARLVHGRGLKRGENKPS
ncbi:MAG: 16S rRNA (adenine(1518)-N(6)/adenine(1519)-N(6))-dimethyltransferase RsmA [Planctomycetota bacterium]